MSEEIAQIRRWLAEVVIGHNLCPFARREIEHGRVRFRVLEATKKSALLEAVGEEMQWLDEQPATETTLLIFSRALPGFAEYLDFLEIAQALLEERGYEGIYQLASFHPEYQFADSDYDDPANFTNRSPLPVLHLLREESIERVMALFPDIEEVPARNIALARDRGRAYWQSLLQGIREGH
jgi:uncharacterized protein